MRLSRESLLVLILATAVCLLAGMIFGIQWGTLSSSPLPTPTIAPTATPAVTSLAISSAAAPILQQSPSAGQVAVLFVGVNDASALLPRLESCWLVAFTPGINHYYVVSIPPEAHFYLASLGGDHPLADIYTQDVEQAVNYRFVRDAIKTVLPGMSIQAEVTLDRSDVADLALKVGGLSVDGQSLVGSTLLTAYDTESFKGQAARLEFQHQAITALFHALADQYWTPESVTEYLIHLPNAVRPQEAGVLRQLASSAPPLQSSEPTWNAVGNVREAATVP